MAPGIFCFTQKKPGTGFSPGINHEEVKLRFFFITPVCILSIWYILQLNFKDVFFHSAVYSTFYCFRIVAPVWLQCFRALFKTVIIINHNRRSWYPISIIISFVIIFVYWLFAELSLTLKHRPIIISFNTRSIWQMCHICKKQMIISINT